ncbi:glycosyltransferase family 4 protein [Roseibacterium sp. SDUM158017]|uniref:glycosyltransferase family 4 protein n=1 Tax=Roseicyclus salinarum TaxID=3036773 RepID=UPI002415799F|nr:glycosyltransferase family 4 protein [Roseibacterium sp. SDUM158017]MDG4649624.1 glycosyltransferase family 4 protein [Roseibacterium sp. SDUM158017]
MPHRVLILAESCNPQWPSLPIVAYKYARALGRHTPVTLVTQVRNRPAIEAEGDIGMPVTYIDNEWIGRPLYLLSQRLRGGSEVAWSTSQIMAYLPYLAFEWQAFRNFRPALRAGAFDIVHRITPMSPTMPSYIAGRTRQPFVIGPLNGNLDWPEAFRAEQKREREGLRRLRGLYRHMPYSRRTFTRASAILAAFQHTIDDLPANVAHRTVSFPEIGFDETLFHAGGRQRAFSGEGPFRFLYAGRLVPYKVPEAAIRAFASSDRLKGHILHIVGDGPELPRLQKMVAEAGAGERIRFEGRRTQAEVAEFMRSCDAFVFPSIRELGAGVVIEAMASGMVCLVTDYGAPGALAADGRGIRIDLQPLDGLVHEYRTAMEGCLDRTGELATMAEGARKYALEHFTWEAKARHTLRIYDAVTNGDPPPAIAAYA